jgi:F-type H+-transporting ATPase subunit gamma
MKTVSAVKLRKAVTELNNSRPFLLKLEELLRRVGQGLDMNEFPLLQERESGRVVLVAVSADKGLCGSFNSHIEKFVNERKKELEDSGEEVEWVAIGKKVNLHLNSLNLRPLKSETDMMGRLNYQDARSLSDYLQDLFLDSSGVKSVEFIYTSFQSASNQIIVSEQLFPLKSKWEQADEDGGEELEYIFEPEPKEIFESFLPRYINSLVFRILLESSASEHAARMIAMDLATRNASDVIRTLTLTMNKLRQASITNEILEIITATEALKD